MLVEDDAPNREAMSAFLAAEGYRVVVAVHGLDALRLLRTGADPSIIVLDVRMPVMNGLEFRREQLRDPGIAHIPVVVCSAEDEMRGRADFAAERWLQKPVDPPELLSTLRDCVGPVPPRRDSNRATPR